MFDERGSVRTYKFDENEERHFRKLAMEQYIRAATRLTTSYAAMRKAKGQQKAKNQ